MPPMLTKKPCISHESVFLTGTVQRVKAREDIVSVTLIPNIIRRYDVDNFCFERKIMLMMVVEPNTDKNPEHV